MLTITESGMMLYEDADLRRRIEEAALAVEPSPSDAQKEYGNYRKGHVTIQGLPITIEYAKGGIRSGKDKDGNVWSVTMRSHYGYIKRTESEADGDHIDVFIGQHPESEIVFVIDQVSKSGRFNEHKAMLAFTNEKEAREGYLANYPDGWKGLGAIKALRMDEFKKWIYGDGTGSRIEDQKFFYIDESGSYYNLNDISDLIIQRSTQDMADAVKRGDQKKLSRSTKRWADELRRRLMLKHLLIDYDYGHYEDRFVTISGHQEGDKKHVGGTVVKISDSGTIEGGGPPALKGTNISDAKETLDKSKGEAKASPEAPAAEHEPASPHVSISPDGKFTPEAERPKNRSERREARRKAGGGKTEKYDPAKDRTGHSLYKIVSRMGGISRASAEKYGIQELMESGLSGLLPKQGGKDIEKIAEELHSGGDIQIPGYQSDEDKTVGAEAKRQAVDPGEHLVELLKSKAKSLHANLTSEYEASYAAYMKELKDASTVASQSEIDEAVRSGEEEGVSEAEKGDAWEGTGESGSETEAAKPPDSVALSDTGELIPF